MLGNISKSKKILIISVPVILVAAIVLIMILVFTNRGISLKNVTVTQRWKEITYNGNARAYPEDKLVLTDADGNVLKRGVDYTVTYKNNTEVGQATVKITGKGNYTGTRTLYFTIRPVTPTITEAEGVGRAAAAITFTQDESADKYYIYVNDKYVGCRTTSDYYYIMGLEAGTTYTVTVKAVKEVNGVKYYSAPSDPVTVTTNN